MTAAAALSSLSWRSDPPAGRRSPTRASWGTASLSISNLFVISSVAKLDMPVTLPPGRARLATRPAPTGSEDVVTTMGIVVVALLAANPSTVPPTTIRSTFRRTKSPVSSGRRSRFCSANRYSMVIFFPSIQPSLLSSCRNASKSPAIPEAVLESRKPMRGFFPACCASTVTPRANNTTATRIDGTAAFFIAHLDSSVMYHADTDKGKCDLHGGRRQVLVEWEGQNQPEIELNDATALSCRIRSLENSI